MVQIQARLGQRRLFLFKAPWTLLQPCKCMCVRCIPQMMVPLSAPPHSWQRPLPTIPSCAILDSLLLCKAPRHAEA
jgi:hypothetical protein